MGEDSSMSSIEDEEDQSLDLLSPRNSAPPDALGKLSSSKGKAGEDEAMLNKVEAQGSNEENHDEVAPKPVEDALVDEEDMPKRHVVPGICKIKMFKMCR